MTTNETRCPHCYGDHDGCTVSRPRCSAGRMSAPPEIVCDVCRSTIACYCARLLPAPPVDDRAATHTEVAPSPIVALRARWAVANNAWLVTFGNAPCGIGPDNRRLFSSRKELRAVVEACGLQLLPSGLIVAKN